MSYDEAKECALALLPRIGERYFDWQVVRFGTVTRIWPLDWYENDRSTLNMVVRLHLDERTMNDSDLGYTTRIDFSPEAWWDGLRQGRLEPVGKH